MPGCLGGTAFYPAISAASDLELTITAPAGAGGGWDSAARSLQEAMMATGEAKSVQVVNVPGADGTVGLAQFVGSAKGAADQLLVAGITLVGASISNNAPVDLTQVTPLARLTGDPLVFVVPKDSPNKTIDDLLATIKKDVATTIWVGGSAGGADHILAALITKSAGVPIRARSCRLFRRRAVGVLPGIGPALTVALLLPVTFKLDPGGSIIMFAGICMYGGSTTAILLNMPGESAAVVTALEGNKMARSGRVAVVGLILGPLAYNALRRSLQMSLGDPMVFLEHPSSAIMIAVATIALIAPSCSKDCRGSSRTTIEAWTEKRLLQTRWRVHKSTLNALATEPYDDPWQDKAYPRRSRQASSNS
ncbi:tripartite tricarboxylate transporter permease [Sinorhizobium sp. CCBAU 05631]|uniref:tripartite tricarboxylate transporter substrate-binding protein n=1 Tax=Sinorhizobium sp. CCBAU 05631 TaxID=794846 RepID=UPI0004ACF4A0|nr:tripartite tricarboxylate transporter permease [Sinorhizobium sp. CCBAU 05631]ASY59332.1 Tricarboxylate transport protein TctC [Sinorhizobium sp. CCBAU 05631]